MTEGQDIIEYLVAHGAYVEAARLCVERGELRRAIQLYERVWRFADAVPLALALGDRPLALRLSLDARDAARAAEIAGEIPDDARAELAAAADAFAGRGRPFEAGRAAERALDFARAAAHYRRANATLDAGRALELGGDLHEAGCFTSGSRPTAATPRRRRRGWRSGACWAGSAATTRRRACCSRRCASPRRAPRRSARWCSSCWRWACARAAAEVLARLRRRPPDAAGVARGLRRRRGDRRRRRRGSAAARRASCAAASACSSCWARAPPAASTWRTTRCSGRTSRSSCWPWARARPAPSARRTFASRARPRPPAACATPTSWPLHDMDEALGLFVFELMAGGTLADRLATRGPLSPAAGRRMALELLAALDAAHERGIIHRDIKPANVFFDAAGNAKLGDFGAAHLVDFGQTQTGGLVGTSRTWRPSRSAAPASAPPPISTRSG